MALPIFMPLLQPVVDPDYRNWLRDLREQQEILPHFFKLIDVPLGVELWQCDEDGVGLLKLVRLSASRGVKLYNPSTLSLISAGVCSLEPAYQLLPEQRTPASGFSEILLRAFPTVSGGGALYKKVPFPDELDGKKVKGIALKRQSDKGVELQVVNRGELMSGAHLMGLWPGTSASFFNGIQVGHMVLSSSSRTLIRDASPEDS